MNKFIDLESYKEDLLELARASVYSSLKDIEISGFEDLYSSELASLRNGVFVSIYINSPLGKRLRGCIGNFSSSSNILDSIENLAKESAFADPRFRPISIKEFPDLRFEITILSKPVKVKSWKEIEIGRHGVVLKYGHSRAVFLPQVAVEQGWDVEQMLCALATKANLYEYIWKESDCSFEVFEGSVLSEY
ncbi:MAG: AmmeMemoRadiSam system protein A [Spirochaetales bacterium]|nr:AmmeMemoRadiSam system protein A [Spirochaetales bacterium]